MSPRHPTPVEESGMTLLKPTETMTTSAAAIWSRRLWSSVTWVLIWSIPAESSRDRLMTSTGRPVRVPRLAAYVSANPAVQSPQNAVNGIESPMTTRCRASPADDDAGDGDVALTVATGTAMARTAASNGISCRNPRRTSRDDIRICLHSGIRLGHRLSAASVKAGLPAVHRQSLLVRETLRQQTWPTPRARRRQLVARRWR